MADPATTALMQSNLYEIFGQRDLALRREAIVRTYTEDVSFTDESGTIVGGAAINDRNLDAHIRRDKLSKPVTDTTIRNAGPRSAQVDP
jgi:hypothetical protein